MGAFFLGSLFSSFLIAEIFEKASGVGNSVLSVSPTRILKETGGKVTIDQRIDNMTLIPEYIFAMDSAIKTILMKKDEDDAFEGKTWIHEENVHHKTRFQYYCDEVSIWERNKGSVYWSEHNRAWSYWRDILSYKKITRKLKEILEDPQIRNL